MAGLRSRLCGFPSAPPASRRSRRGRRSDRCPRGGGDEFGDGIDLGLHASRAELTRSGIAASLGHGEGVEPTLGRGAEADGHPRHAGRDEAAARRRGLGRAVLRPGPCRRRPRRLRSVPSAVTGDGDCPAARRRPPRPRRASILAMASVSTMRWGRGEAHRARHPRPASSTMSQPSWAAQGPGRSPRRGTTRPACSDVRTPGPQDRRRDCVTMATTGRLRPRGRARCSGP